VFTGIIQAMGRIARIEERGGDKRFSIRCPALNPQRMQVGDSVAVNGVCLTLVKPTADGFSADVSRETLSLTTLGNLLAGVSVNLEPALTLATPLGGHLVSGHVDGVGTLVDMRQDGRSLRLQIHAPAELAPYIARKGSITVDGVSLTVNDINGSLFSLNIVPHTQSVTTIGGYQSGMRVNIEVDLLARYLERLILAQPHGLAHPSTVSKDYLAQHGFL
jgi:riboflavin synthase